MAAQVQTTQAESSGWPEGYAQPLVGIGDNCGCLKASAGA